MAVRRASAAGLVLRQNQLGVLEHQVLGLTQADVEMLEERGC